MRKRGRPGSQRRTTAPAAKARPAKGAARRFAPIWQALRKSSTWAGRGGVPGSRRQGSGAPPCPPPRPPLVARRGELRHAVPGRGARRVQHPHPSPPRPHKRAHKRAGRAGAAAAAAQHRRQPCRPPSRIPRPAARVPTCRAGRGCCTRSRPGCPCSKGDPPCWSEPRGRAMCTGTGCCGCCKRGTPVAQRTRSGGVAWPVCSSPPGLPERLAERPRCTSHGCRGQQGKRQAAGQQ